MMRNWAIAAALAVTAGFAPLPAAAPQPQALIPIADFAAQPLLQDPIMSGDGRQIAARATIDGISKVVVLDADRPEAPPKVFGVGEPTIAALQWAGNQRLLLTAQFKQIMDNGNEVSVLRLFAIEVPTGAIRMLDSKSHGVFTEVLYADPSGSWALVVSQDGIYNYPSVKRINLVTGEALLVERERDGVWDWHADLHGVVRAGVSYRNGRWTLWYRNLAGERLRPIRGKFDDDDFSTIDRLIFDRGNHGWIVTNQRTGRFALYEYDFATDTIGKAVYEHPEFDLENVLCEPFSGKLLGVEYDDDRHRTVWFDPQRKALQQKLDKALPGVVNTLVGSSQNDKRHLVRSGGGSNPGTYFLLDLDSSRMHPVMAAYDRIDPALLAPVKAVKYQVRDGLSLPAYLTLPRDRAPKALPLIMLPHGGPFARDDWSYDPLVQFLANRGYAVLQPQFRGSTGYGRTFVERGYGEFGKKMQDDLDDGVDWLARTGVIDPKRVCVVGMSYGGYAAMWGAVRNPERYRCAVSWAGPADLPAMLRYDRKTFSAVRYYREWRSKVAGEGKSDLSAVSPISFADRIQVPLLIGHGVEDQTVPVEQSRRMVRALQKANAKVSSVFYKDSGHNFSNAADRADWFKRLEQFLAANNPA